MNSSSHRAFNAMRKWWCHQQLVLTTLLNEEIICCEFHREMQINFLDNYTKKEEKNRREIPDASALGWCSKHSKGSAHTLSGGAPQSVHPLMVRPRYQNLLQFCH